MNLAGALTGIPADAEPMVLELIARIEKMRALWDDESDVIAEIVRRERRRAPRVYHTWTPAEDRKLWSRQWQKRGVIATAAEMGITETAARSRLRHLRKLRSVGKGGPKVEK
jgi:hypothetical protein